MVSFLVLGFKFVDCVPGIRKWHIAPALEISISMEILICNVLIIVSVSFAEFIASSSVGDFPCVPPLEKLLMTTVFLSSSSDKKVINNYY